MENFGNENPILENRQEEITNPEHVLYGLEEKMTELRHLLDTFKEAGKDVQQAIKNSINAGIEDLKTLGGQELTKEQQAKRTNFLEELREMEKQTS